MVFVAQKGHPLIQCSTCHFAEENNTHIGSVEMIHSIIGCIRLLFPDIAVVWGPAVTYLTLTQVEESLSI